MPHIRLINFVNISKSMFSLSPLDYFLSSCIRLVDQSKVNTSALNIKTIPIGKMVNMVQVALCLSPLILLLPIKTNFESFNRDVLVKVVIYILLIVHSHGI